MLYWEVMGANQSPLQCGEGTAEMHGPLMSLSWDDIVEVSLLEPTGEEHKTSPTLEEEAILLGKELSCQRPRGCCIPPTMSGDSQTCRTHQTD